MNVAHDKQSKASDDANASSSKNAVDRASSRTPLNDDSDIDATEVRRHLVAKKENENKLAAEGKSADPSSSAQSRPGPVQATPDRTGQSEEIETPSDAKREARELPEGDAKDAVRDWQKE